VQQRALDRLQQADVLRTPPLATAAAATPAAASRPPLLPLACCRDPVLYFKHREAKVAEEYVKVAEAKVRHAPVQPGPSMCCGLVSQLCWLDWGAGGSSSGLISALG